MLFGIDLAKWQGKIDWAKVKKDFVILKVTDKSNKTEAAFEENYKGAINRGISVGVYRYVYALNTSQAEVEAMSMICALNGKKIDCGVWLDFEDASIKILSKKALTDIIQAEAKILKQHGYKVGIYCNRDWFLNVLDGKALAKEFPFWIARYPANDKGEFNEKSTLSPISYAKAWQYSQKGKVKGIKGDVDLDVAFVGFDEMYPAALASSNGLYYPKYNGSGTSIISALQTVGEKDTSFNNRAKIALKNGILKYQGTVQQNLQLIALITAGKLLKP